MKNAKPCLKDSDHIDSIKFGELMDHRVGTHILIKKICFERYETV